ncbi:hypothetical protein JCM1841_000105 [Sporobolomyces salmonicolor]
MPTLTFANRSPASSPPRRIVKPAPDNPLLPSPPSVSSWRNRFWRRSHDKKAVRAQKSPSSEPCFLEEDPFASSPYATPSRPRPSIASETSILTTASSAFSRFTSPSPSVSIQISPPSPTFSTFTRATTVSSLEAESPSLLRRKASLRRDRLTSPSTPFESWPFDAGYDSDASSYMHDDPDAADAPASIFLSHVVFPQLSGCGSFCAACATPPLVGSGTPARVVGGAAAAPEEEGGGVDSRAAHGEGTWW